MNSVKNSIKSNRKNQAVIEEQAKAFGSLSKDVSDIKQKLWGMVTTNEKSIKLLASISTAAIIAFTSTGSVFADREMIIPGLPKVEYRNGYGAYEGVVAHSTATPEAPAINIRNYEARTWRSAFVHYATDWDETIQIALLNIKHGEQSRPINDLFM